MAIDFPNSPTLNQIYQSGNKTWIYDGEKWNVYIVTGVVDTTPVGSLQIYAGSTAPTGWLLSFGQALSRTAYAGLFTAIGTTYGVGDGSTTFNLPDLRGRVPAGLDNMGGSAASRLTAGGAGITGTLLGAVGGTETHTLTSAQSGSPAHQHANTLNNNTVGSSTHRHDFRIALNDNYYAVTGTMGGMTGSGAYRYSTGAYQSSFSDGSVTDTRQDAAGTVSSGASGRFGSIGDTQTPSSTTTVGLSNVDSTATNASSAHNNTQPTIVMNYIIKYGPA